MDTQTKATDSCIEEKTDCRNANTDLLIEELGGCGLYQVILVVVASLPVVPMMFVYPFLTFGIYNPGWRCMDNVTTSSSNITWSKQTLFQNQTETEPVSSQSAVLPPTPVYRTDTCQGFDSCRRVEFNPETSTLVTEWALICSRAWVPNIIISLKMIGEAIGQFAVGYVADRFGRKRPFHASILISACLLFISLFSTSWEMFASLALISGLSYSFMMVTFVLRNEHVPPIWRIRVINIPIWPLAYVLFSIIAMITEDWKILIIVICVLGLAFFIPVFWMPESLRWLIAHDRKTEAKKVVEKIARLNKVDPPDETTLEEFFKGQEDDEKTNTKSITVFHLFRNGYRIITPTLGLSFFVIYLVYFALSFGVTKLAGNLYVNMIILALTELPANIISVWVGNNFGRKRSAVLFFQLETVGLIGVALVSLYVESEVKDTTMLVLVIFCKMIMSTSWYNLVTGIQEMYPTIARCTISSFTIQMGMLGSIFAPYLIPSEPETLYLCYLVMGGVTLVCGLALCFIPETKGTQFQDTWDDIQVMDKDRRNTFNTNGIV